MIVIVFLDTNKKLQYNRIGFYKVAFRSYGERREGFFVCISLPLGSSQRDDNSPTGFLVLILKGSQQVAGGRAKRYPPERVFSIRGWGWPARFYVLQLSVRILELWN